MKDSKKRYMELNEEQEEEQIRNLLERSIQGDEQSATIESPVVEGILKKLEPEEREILAMSYSGPLPPPEYLKGYIEAYPEAAEKIFQYAEEEQKHRHYMEKESMERSFRQSSIGLIGGIILSFIFIIGGFVLIIMDKEALGFTMMSPPIVSLVTLLIRGKQKSDEKEKDQNEDKEE